MERLLEEEIKGVKEEVRGMKEDVSMVAAVACECLHGFYFTSIYLCPISGSIRQVAGSCSGRVCRQLVSGEGRRKVGLSHAKNSRARIGFLLLHLLLLSR
jgi:hypothetical protein